MLRGVDVDFLGSWRGSVLCGKQLAGKMAGTRALRCNYQYYFGWFMVPDYNSRRIYTKTLF